MAERAAEIRRTDPDRPLLVAKAALAAALAASGVFLFIGFTKLWFNLDEWDLVAHRGLHLGSTGIFYPHNEHWLTVPIIVWRTIFNLVGVRDYWLYALPLILAHLATVWLLWRFMVRHQVEIWTATLLAITFAFLGVGGANLIWAFQLAFVGSVAFGMLAIDAIETDRTWLAPLWLICSLMCSDLGIPMTLALVCVVVVHRRFRDAAIAVVPALAVFLIWFGAIGHQGVTSSDSALESGNLGGLIRYVWAGLTWSLSGFLDAPHVFGILMVILLAGAAVIYRNAPAALGASAVLFYGFVGSGRVQDGVQQATSSRYSYVAVALLLPLIGWSLTQLVRRSHLRPAVLTALALLVGVNVLMLHREQQAAVTADLQTVGDPQFYSDYSNQEPQIQAAAFLLHQGKKYPGQFPTNSLCAIVPNPQQCLPQDTIDVSTLAALVYRHQFPIPTHVAPGLLQGENSVLNVSLLPAMGSQERQSPLAPSHCTTVGPYEPLKVTSFKPDVLNIFVPRKERSVVAMVTFPALDGTGRTSTLLPLALGESVLKLPFGHYTSAVIASRHSIFQACQPGGAATITS